MSSQTAVPARRRAAAGLAVLALGAAAALAPASPAIGKTTPIVKASKNARLAKTLVVNRAGLTLYRLVPETARRVLCTGTCLTAWPPLTVASARTKLVAGTGVTGKLGRIRRGTRYQVTLRGAPLYTFVGDSARGQATGEGIKSFGGTWRAMTAK
jgi:predicted lipoprotein with Yx(FWY)xxD motif